MRTRLTPLIAVLLLLAVPVAAAGPNITATVVTSGSGDTQGVAAATGLRLVGFSITEDAGAVARLRLRNGTSTAGTELFDVQLAAGESAREWFGTTGPKCASGLFVDRVSGTTRLTLYTVIY